MSTDDIAIVGYGNVGRGTHAAIQANDDLQLAGILTRGPDRVQREFDQRNVESPPIVDASGDIDFARELPADAAVLCGGSKEDLPKQGPKFARHYNVIDSFDTHADIPDYYDKMDRIASDNGHVAIISTGWDPGTFSEERVKADAFLPGANHYTFWGPGVSQGHSDAVRQVEGVKDCRQYTLPIDDAIEQVRDGQRPSLDTDDKHTRLAYVVPEDGADRERIRQDIKQMPNYFAPYDTTVEFITEQEMAEDHDEYPHGGFVIASGDTTDGNSALIEYRVEWDSNPEATGSILVAHARAAITKNERGDTGARTILEVTANELSPRSKRELLSEFM